MGLEVDSDNVIRYDALKWLKSVYNPVVVSFGNLIITTDKQFYFDNSIDDAVRSEFIAIIDKNFTQLRVENKEKPSFVLLKEFDVKGSLISDIRKQDLLEFHVDPVFRMDILPSWKSLSDYMGDLKSKYRVTMKRNLRKGNTLVFRNLSEPEIGKFSSELNDLYQNIAEKALFNSFILNPLYFQNLKRELQDEMEVVGVFAEDKLVAFYSYILGPENLDAHFIGMANLKVDYALYANLLYGLLSDAISKGKTVLNLSRTAPEAKSALGAKAENYSLFTKNSNRLINKAIPLVFNRLYKEENWTRRHPFKNLNHPLPPQ